MVRRAGTFRCAHRTRADMVRCDVSTVLLSKPQCAGDTPQCVEACACAKACVKDAQNGCSKECAIVCDKDEVIRPCGVRITGNMRVLCITALLFSTITSVQVVAAQIAHSEAMMSDCVSMAVDSMTYVLSLFAELARGRSSHKPLELTISLVSQAVLVYATVGVVQEALPTLSGQGQDDDDVNPRIILAFAILGWCFDMISLFAFRKNQTGDDSFGVNMQAALMHVGADFLRSGTTFVLGILIMFFKFDGARTDAIACMVVSGLIFVGALMAFKEWTKEFKSYVCVEKKCRDKHLPLLACD